MPLHIVIIAIAAKLGLRLFERSREGAEKLADLALAGLGFSPFIEQLTRWLRGIPRGCSEENARHHKGE